MSKQLTCIDVMEKIRVVQQRRGTDAYSRHLLDQVSCYLERAQKQLDAAESILFSGCDNASPEDEGRIRAYLLNRVADLTIKDDKALQVCTKSTREEFVWILGHVVQWIRDNQYDAELWRLDYERSSDPGNRCRLTPAQALFLYLVWLKSGRTQAGLVVEFGIDQSSVSRYLRRIEKILRDKLPTARYMMGKLSKMEDIEEIKGLIPDFDNNVLVDGTHVRICRPQDDKRQKAAYSGKKKMHTCNTAVFTTGSGIIIGASAAMPGSKHDITEFREVLPEMGIIAKSMTDPDTPPDRRLTLKGDTGYQGVAKDCPGANVITPIKKPRGGQLTTDQKEFNRRLSSRRVTVEHVMGDLKEYRIMQGPYIGTPEELTETFNVITGLVNLRKMWGRLPPDLDTHNT